MKRKKNQHGRGFFLEKIFAAKTAASLEKTWGSPLKAPSQKIETMNPA
jgi:hypothetical protein